LSTLHFQAGPAPPVLTRHHHAWLSLGLAIFVVYGSLVPFHYQPLSWADGLAGFRKVCSRPVRLESRSDTLANFVLVLPLGYLLMGMLCVDAPRGRRARTAFLAVLVVFPCCLLLSVAVEFAQLWFPPRVSSIRDIVAQAVGAVAGMTTWLVAGQRLTEWFRGVWSSAAPGTLGVRLLPGYLLLLLLIHGMPFDLTLSPAELYRKFRNGRVHLVPFADHGDALYQALSKDCGNLALFLPLGMLLEDLPGLSRRGWTGVLAMAVLLTVALQCVKLFVISRHVDATAVITGSLAVLFGWALALSLRRRRIAAGLSGQTPNQPHPRWQAQGLFVLLFLVWLGVAIFVNWQPFDFIPAVGVAGERLRRLALVPFVDYYEGNYWNSLDQFVHKTLLFLPLGALLALAFSRYSARRTGLLVVLAAAVLAALIEAGQLFLPTRYASITDVIVESGGAWIGQAVALHVRSRLAARPVA
jgi:glycopeptide antibiotics resistance protein